MFSFILPLRNNLALNKILLLRTVLCFAYLLCLYNIALCFQRSTTDYMGFNRSIICLTAVVAIQLLSWCMRCSRKKNRLLPDVEIRDETCAQAGSDSDWGNLLPELRTEIGIRLGNRPDVLRFRSVCKTWCSSLPLPARFPMQVPPPPSSDQEFAYFITEVILSSGWLRGVSFEEVDQSGKCCTDFMYPKRSKLSPINAKVCVDRLMYRISEGLSVLSKAYYIRMASPKKLEHGGQWNLEHNKYAEKIVMISSSSSNGVNPCYARVTDLSVVAHLSWGPMKGRLALLRLQGSSSYDQWKWETDFCTKVFYDISTYRGRLCAIDPQGKLFLMDYESLKMTPLANLPPSMSSDLVGRELFEAGDGQLFWGSKINRDPMVIRLNVRTNEWVHPKKGKEEYPFIPQLVYHAVPPSSLRDPSFWG